MWDFNNDLRRYEDEMAEAEAAYAAQQAEMEYERNMAIQELEAEIQMHEAEISKLQKRIESLSA